MKVRKAVRKIVALGFTSAMIGATLLGAASAADLKDFPRPLFVSNDGVFSGKFVVGAAAAAEDVLGINSITAAVQAAAYKETVVSSTGGAAVTVEGDAYQIKQGSNAVEVMETINTVKALVDKDSLKALASGKWTTGRGTYDYDQYVQLPQAVVVFEKNSGGQPVDDSDKPNWFLKLNQSEQAYEYQLKFVTAAESDESSTANRLKDFENKKIKILGKEMSLIKANNASGLELTFMGGAIQDTLQEGQSKTYSIDGKDYEVTLVTVDSASPAKALFKVNGETTDTLVESDTFRLSDSTEMGIKTVLTQNFAEGKRMVEFYLGAEKIVLNDGSVTDNTYGGEEVQYNSDRAYDTDVRIDATEGSTYKISALYVKWTPRDDYYLGKDVKLSSVTERKGQVFLDGFDYQFKGVNFGSTEKIEVSPSGDRQYYLNFKNYLGNDLKIPFLETTSDTVSYGHTSGDNVRFDEGVSIAKNEYFVLSKETNAASNGRSGYTHLMRYRGCSTSSLICTFRNEATGDTVEVPVTAVENKTAGLTVGGNTYYFGANITANDENIYVDFTGDLTSSATYANIAAEADTVSFYSKYGAKITPRVTVANASGTAEVTNLTIETEESQGTSTNDVFTLTFTQDTTNDRLSVSAPALDSGAWASSTAGLVTVAGSDDAEAYSKYGLYAHRRTDSSNPAKVDFVYPDNQAEALVFVSSGMTSTSTSGTPGELTTKQPVAIPSSASVLDSEVSNAKGQNLIVVGGPCANSVAAAVMGIVDPAKCADGFVEGKATIKLYDSADGMATGKVALLVAGYSAADTRRAATVVANYKDYASKFMGKELTVTGTSLTDITVAAAK